jgi:hypothetical protein
MSKKDEYTNHWIYKGKIFDSDSIDDNYGFVYIITNNINDMQYIGKKFFYSSRKVKGKKKLVESDWKRYYGSNDRLKLDVQGFGKENFTREIIKLCKSKSECGYYEAKYQFETDCLLKEEYYNRWIMCRITAMHIKKAT